MLRPRPAFAAACGLILAATAGAAAAQYRGGQPDVLPPPRLADPSAPADAALRAFTGWYGSQGRPRLLIFWNRALTDETTTRSVDKSREVDERRYGESVVGETTSTRFGEATKSNTEGLDKRVVSRESGSEVVTGKRYSDVKQSASDVLETTFLNAFLAAGADIADREALIRRLSIGQAADERADVQQLEAKALDSGIHYLVEVLPSREPKSPTGLIFLVKIKHLPTSSLVAQFQTPAAPPPGPSRIVAVPGEGFQRQAGADRTTPPLVAVQLATETMSRFGK